MTLSGRSGTPQPMVYKEAQMTPAARHSLRRREEGGSLSLCRVPACAAIAGQFSWIRIRIQDSAKTSSFCTKIFTQPHLQT